MKHNKLLNAGVLFCVCGLSGPLLAQNPAANYPSRPVTIISPFAPGGSVDVESRMYSPVISKIMGQPFVVDYKVGGGTTIGTGYVVKAPPDGYTLLGVTTALTVVPAFYKDLPFSIVKDLAPVSLMARRTSVLMANNQFGPKNFAEYIAHARANPGRVNYGTAGAGEISHLAGSWLQSLTKTSVTFVPFKGTGPALQELMAGRVDVASGIMSTALPLLQSGKVRILAVLGKQRVKQYPDVPTVAESGVPDYEYGAWMGFVAPAAVPPAILNKLSEGFAKTVKTPEIVAQIEQQGAVPVGSTPAEFRQLIAIEVARWQKVVDDSGIKLGE